MSSITPKPRDQWYVIHVLSGYEQRVHRRLQQRVLTEEMGDYIFEVLLPMERVSEIKSGQKTETKRKFFPGYLIINAHLLDEKGNILDDPYYFIQQSDNVIGFAGVRNKPVPMRRQEIDSLLAQIKEREDTVKPKVAFEVGETVKVADGPFQSQTGVVEEIDLEKGKLRVSVSIFGRATPVDLEFWQVERE